MEINLVINAAGASRVIGNHVGTIGDMELVLVSGDTPHAWFTDRCKSEEIHEITLQFSPDLLDDKFLNRNPMGALKQLFDEARRGVLFPARRPSCSLPASVNCTNRGRRAA